MNTIHNILTTAANLAFPVLILYVFYRKATAKRRQQKQYVSQATLIKKEIFHVTKHFGNVPIVEDSYEVTFDISGKEKTFCISSFEYHILEPQDKGLLTYTRYGLLSFADKIKENGTLD